ncbi:MAG: sodium-translocating pyrophosphatase [Candidatus Bathyarchaeia archaeon]|jgi:K(+)-stimulated pyrophosphate-energized sodium pump|nr:sodium-translocating pyrophosphatase [Candidatus Bathyarchaeota archaeon A05DMB-4]MDH7596020.1 sodium-translocating pyrophosphatase [Candidatus Bathyarchaeota archaeon]
MDLTWLSLAVGAFAMLVVAYLAWSIIKEPTGTLEMDKIAGYIEEGAKAFIKRQYKTIAYFVALTLIPIVLFFQDVRIAFAFLFGAALSLLAAYIGLRVAVKANVRTANAARTSSTKAFTLAFRGGAVMGLSVVSLSLIGICILYILYKDPSPLIGFGFGASLAALFAQLGGGIFTKAADIGADLVGKIEQRIPEDDPRNPAVIADLVGDNVGDCAGRGSDLFESISDDYVTAMILGALLLAPLGTNAFMYPLVLGASGILATMVGVFVTRGWKKMKPIMSFNIGLLITAIFCVIGAFASTMALLNDITIFFAVVCGLAASLAVGIAVQYYIGINSRPIRKMTESSERGPALNILTGLSYAFQSPFLPFLFVLATILFAYNITGGSVYGIVGANIGTDLAIGIIMSSDTFGPISDNATGIAQMTGTRNGGTLEELDAMGNTTKAYTKAFASASGTFSTVVIFITYGKMVGLDIVNLGLLEPTIITGLLLGAAFPFLFSSLAIRATGKTAYKVVDEVRRQFREKPEIIQGKTKPDYARCVDIATKNALKQMVAPALLAVIGPIAVGLLLGKFALGAMLLGGLSASALLSPFFTFGGGIWDNTKKNIEQKFWMKGTPTHFAAVIGDTVGDPLKDVVGPSLNIFMKLTNMTALLITPLLLTL